MNAAELAKAAAALSVELGNVAGFGFLLRSLPLGVLTMSAQNFGSELAAQTIGCRVRFSWLGGSRSLDDNQQEQAAALFSANAKFLNATKKLFDATRPEFRAVNRVKTNVRAYWNNSTLPFTEPGVRLLKRSDVDAFSARLGGFADELAANVAALNDCYSELLAESRERLGALYNPADYPETLDGAFSFSFDFPNLAPPDYLATLAPELYERERQRLAAQFSQAVELAEQSFAAELAAMLERITSTLNGETDGKPKIFRDSMIDNVNEFFARFRSLNLGSSAELAAVVERAESALRGVTPAALRSSIHVRDMVKSSIATLSAELESGLIDRPSRRIRIAAAATPAEPTPPAVEPVQTEPTPAVAAELGNAWEVSAAELAATVQPAEPATVAVEPAGVASSAVAHLERLLADNPAAAEPQPVAVVSREIADAFGLPSSPAVRIVEPESVDAEPQPVDVAAVELPSVAAGFAGSPVHTEPTPAVAAEPVNAEPTPAATAGVAGFAFNFGGGVVRRLQVAGK